MNLIKKLKSENSSVVSGLIKNKYVIFTFFSLLLVAMAGCIFAFRTNFIIKPIILNKEKIVFFQFAFVLATFFSFCSGVFSFISYPSIFFFSFFGSYSLISYSCSHNFYDTAVLTMFFVLTLTTLVAFSSLSLIKSLDFFAKNISVLFKGRVIRFTMFILLFILLISFSLLFIFKLYYGIK